MDAISKFLEAARRHEAAGNWQEAARLYSMILARVPGHGQAAQRLRALQRPAQGKDILTADTVRALLELHAGGQQERVVSETTELLQRFPGVALLHNLLGAAYAQLRRFDEAVAACRKAIEIDPAFAEAHNNMGNIFVQRGELPLAVSSFNSAIELKPDLLPAYRNLAIAYRDLCEVEKAVETYRRAQRLSPALLVHEAMTWPVIPASREELDNARDRAKASLQALRDGVATLPWHEISDLSAFYPSYDDRCNREIKTDLAGTLRDKVRELSFTSTHIDSAGRESQEAPLRLGLLSDFFNNHTIGTLYEGMIRGLDRNRFTLVLIHGPKSKVDPYAGELDDLADEVVRLQGGDISVWQKQVAQLALDVLFYPEIGMSSPVYFLAFARLAPVQVASFGHPDTTGIDTIDYFVSAENIEIEDAHEHYSETLVRLSRIPIVYRRPAGHSTSASRASLGLPESGNLYGCPQSLFKLHPDFDKVLMNIIRRDPAGHIVLVSGQVAVWEEKLKARWKNSCPELLGRALFLPRVPRDRFLALVDHFDVLLDPLHFGSGNTLYEGFATGVPIVTCPGPFMRSRLVAGAYRQMQVDDAPVADDCDEYVELAVGIANAPGYRESLKQSILSGHAALYDDEKALRDLGRFFTSAYAAFRRGERLDSSWRTED